jgi:hypothetical protein
LQGQQLVIGEGTDLRVLDAFKGTEIKAIPAIHAANPKFTPAGNRLAAAYVDFTGNPGPHAGKVTVWDTTDWRVVGTVQAYSPKDLHGRAFHWAIAQCDRCQLVWPVTQLGRSAADNLVL